MRMAIDAGCWLSINTDSHNTDQLDQIGMGVQTARRGWASPDRVLNTLPVDELRTWVQRKRSGK